MPSLVHRLQHAMLDEAAQDHGQQQQPQHATCDHEQAHHLGHAPLGQPAIEVLECRLAEGELRAHVRGHLFEVISRRHVAATRHAAHQLAGSSLGLLGALPQLAQAGLGRVLVQSGLVQATGHVLAVHIRRFQVA